MKKVLSRIFIGLFVLLLIAGGIVGGLYLSGRNKLRTEVLAGEDLSAIGGFEDPIPTETLPVMGVNEEGDVVLTDADGKEIALTETEDPTPTSEVFNTEPANTVILTGMDDGVVTYKGQKYRYNEDLVTILVMGIDKPHEIMPGWNASDGGQADAVFLLLLDGSSGQINVVAINRNSMVQVDVYNRNGTYNCQALMQLALQHAYGDALGVSNQRMA